MSFGSPRESALDSPVSPTVVTPLSGRSSFEDPRIASRSPRSPLSSVAGRRDSASAIGSGYHDDPYRVTSAAMQGKGHFSAALHAALKEPEQVVRSWRPW